MKRISAFIVFIVLLSTACQNKIAADKEYATTLNGTLTKPAVTFVGRIPANGATVTDGISSTTSDSSGKYSLTVYHNGSFVLQITGPYIYNEIISTKSLSLIKNVDF